ncbi:uncharacterized protein PRCAT00000896001 [Priceomyces carsonii]|uniref:uncharacterized protein n=1 Tax=Priceomyces carsonii TaxID=28549 RepID=UPI002EDA2735|nr:unnamed protein product [Priceomyces carsonii]
MNRSKKVDDEPSSGDKVPLAFRDEFLNNAGSSDSLGGSYRIYNSKSRMDHSDNSIELGNNNYVSDETAFRHPYGGWDNFLTKPKQISNSSAEYELDTLGNSSSHLNQDHSRLELNPFEDHPRYQEALQNPFDSSNHPLPEYAPFESEISHKDELDNEQKKIRRNERARLRQLRLKPRFHYTKLPYLTILLTTIQIVVFIVELARMSILTGSAFQTKPYFNPMLGPSTYLLINMGARYVPCMAKIKEITDDLSINFPCANSTTTASEVCSLSELCGMSGVPVKGDEYLPDQWYRIITPIFLHAGFLHIIFNLLLQVTMGWVIEQNIGSIKFFIIYMLSGIAGFLLGSNFAPDGIASTGASGSLFGIVATNIMMFIYCGRKNTNIYGTKHFKSFIFIMLCEIIVSFVLGLLPGLDNFSHIGGFAMGLLMGVVLLPDPFFIYGDGIFIYNGHDSTLQRFINNWNPFHNYEEKVPWRFFVWCGARVVCLVLAILYYVLLAKNFFNNTGEPSQDKCKWCKYINCIPVHGWCDIGEVSVESENTSSSNNKRSLDILEPFSNLQSRSSVAGHLGPGHEMGAGIYILLGLMTLSFFKKKKII